MSGSDEITAADFVAFGPDDAHTLAALHASAFTAPWDAPALCSLLAQPGVFAVGGEEAGFILCRVVADEAEVLTLATNPAVRRGGLGRRLVETAAETAADYGANSLFLEVAEDNVPARALYARTGFLEAGRRKGYYARPDGLAVDALVLVRKFDADFIERLPSG